MNDASKTSPRCPVSVVTTAKPRASAASPTPVLPSGGATVPFSPPPPWNSKRPFHSAGSASAKPIPYGRPSAPVRRSSVPSSRQYAGSFTVSGGKYGGSGGGGDPA